MKVRTLTFFLCDLEAYKVFSSLCIFAVAPLFGQISGVVLLKGGAPSFNILPSFGAVGSLSEKRGMNSLSRSKNALYR